MKTGRFVAFVLAGMLLALGVASLMSQELMQQESQVKRPPIPYSNPQSGEQMYKDYCAACHGPTGKGDGPVAAFLKTWPPDLTTMSQRNKGKYPEVKVKETLLFGASSHAHGTSDMPVWGPLFQTTDQSQKEANARVSRLTQYLESIQHP
ncbi:MAG TPA: c-type cytochrome [Candidatus Eisenbacteria bacterium]|nr:c-type cytochrome [Candidatus Eisenbacteria bacterium]